MQEDRAGGGCDWHRVTLRLVSESRKCVLAEHHALASSPSDGGSFFVGGIWTSALFIITLLVVLGGLFSCTPLSTPPTASAAGDEMPRRKSDGRDYRP